MTWDAWSKAPRGLEDAGGARVGVPGSGCRAGVWVKRDESCWLGMRVLVRLSNVGTDGEDGGSRAWDAGVCARFPSDGAGCLFSLLVADFQQPTTLKFKQSLIFF